MSDSSLNAFWSNFLGESPNWYKQTIIGFIVINPLLLMVAGPVVTGWALIAEFIFTLALALRCYPLQPGGLLAIEGILLGLADPHSVFHEAEANFEVILLLMFMVAGIYFMKDLLLCIHKDPPQCAIQKLLAFLFSIVSAVLSAFLDALTVTAVLISVGVGFYAVFHRVASGMDVTDKSHDHTRDTAVQADSQADLEAFRAFLRSLLMHGAVGTALGGVCTLVGEPQNLLIATVAGWDFQTFFLYMAPITMPVLACGLITCVLLEVTGWFGYGALMPENVRQVLTRFDEGQQAAAALHAREPSYRFRRSQPSFLCLHLPFTFAAVGLIGLLVIVLLTAFNGITDEHEIGHAFQEALPFTALLVVFFAIVAVIHEQHLFTPVIESVLAMSSEVRPAMFFLANGILSAISDNVFVATVYISEIDAALKAGEIDRAEFDRLAIAINTGTNLPSVATPNGQAAFLFLLTSALAPLIRLSYGKMVLMALPTRSY